MPRTIPALALGAVLLVLPACGTAHRADSASASGTSTSTTAAGPLEGTWTTNLTKADQRSYLRTLGYGRDVADAVAGADNQNIPGPHFAVEFLGHSFRMYYEPTGETWQSGTFAVHGHRLVLDDEPPVGHLLLSFRVDGDHATFSHFGSDMPDLEFMPGVPDWVPGAAMWGTSTWTRQ